jgi:hypothetical protein
MAPAVGLARLVQAAPVGGEQPAVIRATDVIALDLPEVQRRTAMAAPRREQAGYAVERTVEDEVFAEDANSREIAVTSVERATACQDRRSSSPAGVPAATSVSARSNVPGGRP